VISPAPPFASEKPRRAEWCLNMLRGVVRDNKLDLLEHDQTMIVGQVRAT